jgi:hypothetical protein
VPPFRPLFQQQPRVFSANHRFSTLLFSASSELLFPQLLSFHNHLRCPLFFLSVHSVLRASPLRLRLSLNSLVFSGLAPLLVSCLSFSHSSPLFSVACSLFSQNTGVWGRLSAQRAPRTRKVRTLFIRSEHAFWSRTGSRNVPTVRSFTQRGRLPHIQVSLLQAQGSQVNG